MSQQPQQQKTAVQKTDDRSLKIKEAWFDGYGDIPGETAAHGVKAAKGYAIEFQPWTRMVRIEKLMMRDSDSFDRVNHYPVEKFRRIIFAE